MKIDLSKERANPVMKRKEVEISIDHPEEATPSKAALQQLVAKQIGVQIEKTDIRQITSGTGRAKSRAVVFIWDEPRAENLAKAKQKEAKPDSGEEAKEEAAKEAENGKNESDV